MDNQKISLHSFHVFDAAVGSGTFGTVFRALPQSADSAADMIDASVVSDRTALALKKISLSNGASAKNYRSVSTLLEQSYFAHRKYA